MSFELGCQDMVPFPALLLTTHVTEQSTQQIQSFSLLSCRRLPFTWGIVHCTFQIFSKCVLDSTEKKIFKVGYTNIPIRCHFLM